MPKLKQLVCSIELGQSRTPLQEYGAHYSDGAVESFVAVPDTKIPFCIRLKSEGYIAPGLAAFVFMDGQYQCNRNKLQLRMPDDGVPESEYEIDFCLRQKEEKTANGTFVGRQWSFAELNTTKSDKAANLNPRFLHNIGTIEVVVLRCKREGEDVPTPRLQAGLIPPVPPKAPSEKRIAGPTQAPSAAPAAKAKQPTPAPSDALGGLCGLFDGACDDEEISLQHKKPIDTHLESVNTIGGLDGAGDFPAPYQHVPLPPVGRDGYVMPRAPSGYTWDPVVGRFLPVNEVGHYHSERQHDGLSEVERALKVRRDDRSAIHQPGKTASLDSFPVPVDANVDAALGNTDERGQLDGYGGPNVNIYQGWAWENRGYDDMQGDRYLGMTGADRVNQKMKMREQGHPVSPSQAPIQHSIPQGYGRVANSMPQQYIAPQYSFQQDVARQSHGNPNVPIEFGILELQQKIFDIRSRLVENNDETTNILEQLRANHGKPGNPSLMQRLEYLQNELDPLTKQLDIYSNGLNDYIQNASKNPDEEDLEILQKLRQMEKDARTKKAPAAVPPVRYPMPAVNGWQQTGQGEAGRATTGKPPRSVERPGGLANKLNERYARVAAQNTQQSDAKEVQEAQQDWVNGPKAIDWAYEQPHGTGWTGSGKGHRTLPQEPRAGGTGWADDDKGPQSSPQRAAVDNWGAPRSPQQWSGNDNAGSNGATGQQQNNNEAWSGSASHRGRQQDNGGWSPAVSHQGRPHSHRGGSVYNATSPSGRVNDAGWADGTVASDQGRREKTPSIFIQSPSPGAHVKSYWADWRQTTMPQGSPAHGVKKHEAARDPCDYPSAPLPTVPEGKLKDIKHGIQAGKFRTLIPSSDAKLTLTAGKGANYSHRCHRPLYMDTMAEPYAVFSFKYRSKEALEKILKRDVSSDVQAIVKQAEEEKFLNMPKHKLVEELMKMRLPGGSPSPKKALTDSAASGWGGGAETRGLAGNGWDSQSNGGKQTHVGGWGERSAHGGGHSSPKSVRSISKGYAANAGWDDPQPQQADLWGGNSARETNNQAGWANDTPAAGGGWDGAGSSKPMRYKAPAVHDIDSEGSLATGFSRSSPASPVPVHNFGGFAERQKMAHHDGPASPIAENAGDGAGDGALHGQGRFGHGHPGANYPGFTSAGQGLLPWGNANGYASSDNPMKKWEKGGWAREMVEGAPKF
ncbi:hypothetical protein D0868_10126 [Hortaea werneckii]|uniref:DUF7918 domain-containing protein n=1 Tax=Hortaea werneckii TaxID=91943 RepID=A0A3M6Y676_HORWE|nr:hypothetical protein D0868_10126 [Hortaea werneckii]